MNKETKLLNTLDKVNSLCEQDKLPKALLSRIYFNEHVNSSVSVFLQADDGKFWFMFHLHVPYEAPDEERLSPDEVYKLIGSEE